jgi:hypothetical protein
MILIGIFIVSFISIIAKTNRTIAELKSREGIECNQKPMNQSPALISGMMLNCMTLCLPETISDYIKIPLQIFAIILMLYGIYQGLNFGTPYVKYAVMYCVGNQGRETIVDAFDNFYVFSGTPIPSKNSIVFAGGKP